MDAKVQQVLPSGILNDYKDAPPHILVNDTLAALQDGGDLSKAYIQSIEAIHEQLGCTDFKIQLAGIVTSLLAHIVLENKNNSDCKKHFLLRNDNIDVPYQ